MQTTHRLASCHLALAGFLACAAAAAADVDKYGGFMDVQGTPGASFSVQKIGGRWWIVTPDGHGTFIRTVSKVDTNNDNVDCGGSGNFLTYDAVYIQPKDGRPTANLQDAAASTITRDVVHPKSGVTLKDAGDAFFIGSGRFKPNFTYFWLDQLGARRQGPVVLFGGQAVELDQRQRQSSCLRGQERRWQLLFRPRQFHGPGRQGGWCVV